jgi:hypothetical protein
MRYTTESDCLDFDHKHHIQIRLKSSVLDKQIELLQLFNEKSKGHFKSFRCVYFYSRYPSG